jgi:endonuclease YncB( thermonuclease family)
MKSMKRWWMVLCCAVAFPAAAQTLQGTVTRVVDGDSVWVAPATAPGAPIEVRLLGIDAPEICQLHGSQARDALRELVLGQTVGVNGVGRDTYGRLLATITLEGLDVNRRQVAEGHAWSSRHKWDQGPYVKQERQAKALGRGLHAAGGAVMPSEFRRSHGPCESEAVVASPGATPAPSPATPAAPAVLPPPAAFRCDGRTRCTQMQSCEEAKFFLKNCPGVQMDGDRDGVPCEQQWCR